MSEMQAGLPTNGSFDGNFYTPPKPSDRPVFNLGYQSMKDVCETDYPDTEYIINEIMPCGFGVCAGNPKIGKSLSIQQLAVAVATGTPFLGLPTKKSNVLYLDLESSGKRTKDRAIRQGVTDFPENISMVYAKDLVDQDGQPVTLKGDHLIYYLEDMVSFLTAQDKRPGLVIIDTLIKVKGGERGTLNQYENDSAIWGKLQNFAISNDLCIIGVAHLHKELNGVTDTDWIERISGSMGLAGVCDFIWGMFKSGRNPNDREARFRITGRDIPDNDFVIRSDPDTLKWEMVSNNAKDYQLNTHPFFKYVISCGEIKGTSSELVKGYLEFCRSCGIPSRIVETDHNGKREDDKVLAMRFSAMIRKIKDDLPLINYEYRAKSTSGGTLYSITKHVDLE